MTSAALLGPCLLNNQMWMSRVIICLWSTRSLAMDNGHGMKTESKYGTGWRNTDHCGYITDNSVLLLCYSSFIGCSRCAALNTIILRSVLIKRSSSPMTKYFGCSIHCPLWCDKWMLANQQGVASDMRHGAISKDGGKVRWHLRNTVLRNRESGSALNWSICMGIVLASCWPSFEYHT